jgi:hypothetical protein
MVLALLMIFFGVIYRFHSTFSTKAKRSLCSRRRTDEQPTAAPCSGFDSAFAANSNVPNGQFLLVIGFCSAPAQTTPEGTISPPARRIDAAKNGSIHINDMKWSTVRRWCAVDNTADR